jgi:hypothetical protein
MSPPPLKIAVQDANVLIDMETGAEGEVNGYPTPEDLWRRTFAKESRWRDLFAMVPFEDRGGYFQSRYYQDIAIERVLEAIAAGRFRILLTLATGTGKTFIAFQIAWKLFQSRWNLSGEPTRRPRILFLARVSTDKQANARQIHELRHAAAENGWTVVEVIETAGLSGNAKDADHHDLDRIRALATDRSIRKVLVWVIHKIRAGEYSSLVGFGCLDVNHHGAGGGWKTGWRSANEGG